jgi:cold shock protein
MKSLAKADAAGIGPAPGWPSNRLYSNSNVTFAGQVTGCIAGSIQSKFPLYTGATQEKDVATGKVKWFNPTKGYGFIQPTGGGADVFVHISAVERAGLSTLQENQAIEFEIVSNRGRNSAENLKVK